MTEATLVHELDTAVRNAAVAAYAKCHGGAPDLGFAPDRAWIEGWAFAQPAGVPAAAPDARDAIEALEMLVGENAKHSLLVHEGEDVFGRVKGTWSVAAYGKAKAALQSYRAAQAKGEQA